MRLGWAGVLTHCGRMTHICVDKLTIIGSDNGLSPGRRQAIIRTNAGILLIGSLVTNFSEISIGIQTFSFKKMHLKMPSAKWRPFCLGLNVLTREVLLEVIEDIKAIYTGKNFSKNDFIEVNDLDFMSFMAVMLVHLRWFQTNKCLLWYCVYLSRNFQERKG